MFAKFRRTVTIVAVMLACVTFCGCENSDGNKQPVSPTTVTTLSTNRDYVASRTESVQDETAPEVTTVSSQSKVSKKTTTTVKKNSTVSKTTSSAVKTTSAKVTIHKPTTSTSRFTTTSKFTETTTTQTTTSKNQKPADVPETDIIDSENAKLIISQIPRKDRIVFDKIIKGIRNFSTEITFSRGEATQQQVENALLIASLTNLEDNYVSPEYVISVDNLGNVSKVLLKYSKTPEQHAEEVEALRSVVEEIVESCIAENDYEAVKYFHDEIIRRCKYDSTATNMLSAYGCLVDGKAVCEGYAKAFILLCTAYDIECVPITGNTRNSEGVVEPHMWNMVKLDGVWYHFDLTWDDPISTLGDDFVKYDYFAVSDQVISTDHELTPIVYFTYPVADNSENDYFTRYGLNFGDVDVAVAEFERLVAEAVSRNERFVRIRLSDAENYSRFKTEIFESENDGVKEIFNILKRASESSRNELFNPRRYGKIFSDDKYIITVILNYE